MKIEAKVARGIRDFSQGLAGIPADRRAGNAKPPAKKIRFLWFLRREESQDD